MVRDFQLSRFEIWCALKFVLATCSALKFGTQSLVDQWGECKCSNGELHFRIAYARSYRSLLVCKPPLNKLPGEQSVADQFVLTQSGMVAITTMPRSDKARGKAWQLRAWSPKLHFVATTYSLIVSVANLPTWMPTTTVLVCGTNLKWRTT